MEEDMQSTSCYLVRGFASGKATTYYDDWGMWNRECGMGNDFP